MDKILRIDLKRFGFVENASKTFQRDLIPYNIMGGFRWMEIWPLGYDALTNGIDC